MSRSHFEIMYNILLLSRRKKSTVNIPYEANLSFSVCQVYFRLLLEKNLLYLNKIDGHNYYGITEKGISFLESFNEIQDYLSNKEMKMLLLNQK
jgi:predicted transcriptional regulator